MAITYPLAEQHQLAGKSTVPLQPRFINIHTMAGSLLGSRSWFSGAGRPYSHFGTGGHGEVEQWQDLTYRAASDLQGNPYSISIENADHGPEFAPWSGSDVPAFTDAQADALIKLCAWLCVRFAIPPVAAADSIPVPHAVSVHRLGIDPWRVVGGLRYSSSDDKVCPGDIRIYQVNHEIIPAVAAIVGGRQLLEEDIVLDADKDEIVQRVVDQLKPHISAATTANANRILEHLVPSGLDPDKNMDLWSLIKAVDGHAGDLEVTGDGNLEWKTVRWDRETLEGVRKLVAAVLPNDA